MYIRIKLLDITTQLINHNGGEGRKMTEQEYRETVMRECAERTRNIERNIRSFKRNLKAFNVIMIALASLTLVSSLLKIFGVI
nr:MAG TPA: hypothetical protein [Caudoviricetes sp.]